MLQTIKSIPVVGERLASLVQLVGWFLELLGWRGVVVTSLLSIATAGLAILQSTPLWAVFLIFLTAIALSVFVYHRYLLIKFALRFDPRKFREIGDRAISLATEIARFETDAAREILGNFMAAPGDPLANDQVQISRRWQQERYQDSIIAGRFNETFGGRARAMLVLMVRLGIHVPVHLPSVHSAHDIRSLSTYLSLIGELLRDDKLQEAQALTQDELLQMVR